MLRRDGQHRVEGATGIVGAALLDQGPAQAGAQAASRLTKTRTGSPVFVASASSPSTTYAASAMARRYWAKTADATERGPYRPASFTARCSSAMPVLRAVDPAAPAVQDEAVGAGVGEGLAGRQTCKLSDLVDVGHFGFVQLDRAHDPGACCKLPPRGPGQQVEIAIEGALQPGALLAGLDQTGGTHRHGQGELAFTHRGLDEGEIALDKPYELSQPGVAPADVFAEDGRV